MLQPKITKDYILENVSQEQIFEQYLQIQLPKSSNIFVKSPIRKDDNPTVTFMYNKQGKLKMKDWNGHFWGDCFDLVGYMLNENSNEKEGFINILKDIAYRNGILAFKGEYTIVTPKNYESLKEKKEKVVIEFQHRPFNKYDGEFWTNMKVKSKTFLLKKNCVPVQEAFNYYNGNQNSFYCYLGNHDICFAYYFGKDEKNNSICQLYFPNRIRKLRWKTTHFLLFGLSSLIPNKICIITKSWKDVIVFENIISLLHLPISVICVPAENYVMTKEEYDKIKMKCNIIITVFDFDFTGRNLSYKYKTTYNCIPLFFTDGTRGSKYNYKAKDMADYAKNNTIENCKNLVQNIYNYIKRKYNDNSCNFKRN